MVANRECHKGDKEQKMKEREGMAVHKLPTVIYNLMMIMAEKGDEATHQQTS